MRRGSVSSHSLGTFPSPGAPDYRENGALSQKGWCSERVPHPSSSSSRRHVGSASALTTPFYGGRTLPSKWEDAERWICSPVSGGGGGGGGGGAYKHPSSHSQLLLQRRPKSKSGPIVPPGLAYYSSCSPALQVLEAGSMRGLMVGSPFSTGVLAADRLSLCYGGAGGGVSVGGGEDCVARLASLPVWSDLVSETSLPSPRDENIDDIKEAEIVVSPVVSRKDMATQMSPEDSAPPSPRERSSSACPSPPPSIISIADSQQEHPSKVEIKEVQIDKRATMIRWSKRHASKIIKKGLPDIEDFHRSSRRASSSSWDISDATTSISKLQREEAKINAWENLQKAKAEAAIRKLEMELEKKKSASMDKILKKLRTAQMKAQEMRSSVSDKQEEHHTAKNSEKLTFFHKHVQMNYLRSCFTCHAV